MIFLAGLGLAAAFLLGFKWPRTVPELMIVDQPVKPLLAITSTADQLTAIAATEALLSIDDQIAEVGESISVAWDSGPETIRWWSPDWSVEILFEGDFGSLAKAPDKKTRESTGSAKYVASSGGKKYHPSSGCHYADRIKPENLIYFESTAAAEAAGYEPSSCFEK